MDDTPKRRGFGPSIVARLLLEASADPQLRVLFGLPPKGVAPHGMRHPQLLLHRRRRRHLEGPKDSLSSVVPFPIVARPRPLRDGAAPPMRQRRRRAAPKPPPKTP